MHPRDWPLSAAATQLLVDVRPDRRRATTDEFLMRQLVRELLYRGAVRVDELRGRPGRQVLLLTADADAPALTGAPPAVALLAARLEGARRRQLRTLIEEALRADRKLMRRLRRAIESELTGRRLARRQPRIPLGRRRSRRLVLTDEGRRWQDVAAAAIVEGSEVCSRSTTPAAEELAEFGPLLILARGGLAAGARAATLQGAAARQASDAAPADADADAAIAPDAAEEPATNQMRPEPMRSTASVAGSMYAFAGIALPVEMHVFDGLGQALGGLVEQAAAGIDHAVDGIGEAVQDALGSIDAAVGAIDAGVSDGFSHPHGHGGAGADGGGWGDGGASAGGGDGGGGDH